MISNKCKMIDWKIRPLVFDIQRMLMIVPNWRLRVVRSANAAPDWIAVQTRIGVCMSDWILLFSLVGILNKDGLSAPCFWLMD